MPPAFSSSDTPIAMWPPPPAESGTAPDLNRFTLSTFTVLLVEPHADTADMYADFLDYHRIRVIRAADAAAALAAVSHSNLVVTNIALPGAIDGVELIARLRKQAFTRRLPVIALSASVFSNDRDRASRAGCDIFVWKPCLPNALLALVRRLRQRPPLEAARSGDPAHDQPDLARPIITGDAIGSSTHHRRH